MMKKIAFVFILASQFLFAADEKIPPLPPENGREIAAGPSPPAGFAPEVNAGVPEEIIDPRVLRDFIESRGLINCRQKEGTLSLYGDVRARWIATNEFNDKGSIRGFNRNDGINVFKSEVNLFFDYATPRAWLTTKLKWATLDGVDAGAVTRVDIDRAFIGCDVYTCGEEDLYVELGRSKLDYLFESRVEFSSFFDGIHFYYTKPVPAVGVFTIHGGPFIVDSYSNHYAWVVEAWVSNWLDTGLMFKYSIVDWNREATTYVIGKISDHPPIGNNPRYRFLVSQMIFGYERKIDFAGCKSLYVYGAVLANHDAKRSATTNWKKLNGAWYAGFTLGKLCKGGDWSFDINYQSVQAQAIPEFDLSGIGHGNSSGAYLSDALILGLAPDLAQGFTNYKGWDMSLLYAITDSLSLRAHTAWSTPRNKEVGGNFFFETFDMTVIFAF